MKNTIRNIFCNSDGILRLTIPSNIVAIISHFKEEEFFEIDEKDKETPKVSF